MHLYLHPTLSEALTLEALTLNPAMAGPYTLTRWSLATTPATPLLQRYIYYDTFMYRGNGQLFTTSGGLSAPLDDGSFALMHVDPRDYLHEPILELCQWQDLSTVRTIPFPMRVDSACSPACSPDGRWLVANTADVLFLFDRLSGEVMSYHQTGCDITALAFDGTSRFIAGILSNQGGGELLLWRLDPIEHYIPYSDKSRNFRETIPVDHVRGKVALSRLHSELSSELGSDIVRSFGDLAGDVAFSPDSRMVVFSFPVLGLKQLLVAYEVPSGNLLWLTSQEYSSSPCVFAPGGNMLIASNVNGELLCYRGSDGSLLQRVSTGLEKPIEALAFDHDGTSLWLASEQMLVRYPLPLDL